MPDEKPNLLSPAQERQNALSRWDNEGGAGPQGSQKGSTFVDLSEVPPLTNAELVQASCSRDRGEELDDYDRQAN